MKSSSRHSTPLSLAALSLVLLAGPALRADVSLPAIFGTNMVLQCDVPVPVWGRATPGEHVRVRFQQQDVETVATDNGTWQAKLAPMPSSATAGTMVIAGRNQIEFSNVLVGEVWLCSGQSNMTLPVKDADRATEEIAAAKSPLLRLFTVRPNAGAGIRDR